MDILKLLEAIKLRAGNDLAVIHSTQDLESLRVRLLGKSGDLTGLLRGMGKLSPEDRPRAGQMINAAREELTSLFLDKAYKLSLIEREQAIAIETLDTTEPHPGRSFGCPHPITLVLNEIVHCFVGMGFEVVEGPEIELDRYNFELLNLPPNHPARDAQDTFYMNEATVLRTHTSPVQARTMLSRKPPIRIICPGRVYRADEADASHSPVFHQIEGLAVDEDISMADLRGTLDAFARYIYGDGIITRFRPSFFPFTEPSAEVDLTCVNCRGKGCRVCKETGWIEVLGCGMVNPKVLELCGINPEKYSGFAFGIGLDRIAMQRYGIPDMRMLFEGDLRLLKQLA